MTELQEIAFVVGVVMSPMYAILIWRLKASREVENKVTKICTFLKLKFPKEAKRIF